MRHGALCVAILLSVTFAFGNQAQQDDLPVLTGPCLGQKPPGLEPVLFAPGFINTGMHTRDVAITPDGKYFFFMSSRFLPREKWPAALSYGDLRTAFSGSPNGSSAIYWVDAKIIEELRPKELH